MKTKNTLGDQLGSIRRYTAHFGRPPIAGEVENIDIFRLDFLAYRCQFSRCQLYLLPQRMAGQWGMPTEEATVVFESPVYAIVSVISATILNEVCKSHE